MLQGLVNSLEKSRELRDIKKEEINKFLSSIVSSEQTLKDFYSNHEEVIKRLGQISSLDSEQKEEKLKIYVQLKELSVRKKALQEMNEKLFKKSSEILDSIVQAIEKGEKEHKISESSPSASSGGGAQEHNKKLKVKKLRKH
ncbi:hypothetical protein [Mycoplasma suis]|uniref:hypothetical protein n=1 Tax=Mycoplasma suis TaxID=57372 RepID=UPI0011D2555C|nr:hypothetical protein [Mycoplasma suis]